MINQSASILLKSVSVIIINLNGGEALLACIQSVEMSYVREIIIVDNGSSDDSIESCLSFFPNLVVIRNKVNLGFAGPCNQGAEIAEGDFLLFLNNDAKLTPGSLEKLVHEASKDSVAGVSPKIIDEDGGIDSAGSFFTLTGFLHHITEAELSFLSASPKRFSLKGACFLVKKRCFFEVGGFDNSFFAYFEESDLCWRLVNKEYDLIYLDTAYAIHEGGRTTKKVFKSSFIDYLSFRNRIISIRRNLPLSTKLLILPLHLVCCLFFAFAFLLIGKPKNALAIYRAIIVGTLMSTNGDFLSKQSFARVNLKTLRPLTTIPHLRNIFDELRRYLVRW